MDTYDDNREFRRAVSTNNNPLGSYREDVVRFREVNADLLLSYSDTIAGDWQYTLSAGSNILDQGIRYKFTEASQLSVPGVYTLANSRTPLKVRARCSTSGSIACMAQEILGYKNPYILTSPTAMIGAVLCLAIVIPSDTIPRA